MGFFGSRAAWVMALLVVVLALPAFGVTAYLEYEISTQIQGVQNERAGLARLVALAGFQNAAAQYAIQRQCGMVADTALIRRADAALARFDASAHSEVTLPESWPGVGSAWQRILAGSRATAASDSLFAGLDDTFMAVGDQSGVTYDADFAGVSLADATSYRLPEALAQLDSARGLLCTYGAVPTLDQRLALKQRQVLFDKLIDDAMLDTRDGIRLLAPRMDVNAMRTAYPAANRAASRASADLGAYMLTSGAPALAAAQRSLGAANTSLVRLLGAEFPALDRMLEQRLADFYRQRLIRLIPALVGLFAAILVATLGVRLLSQQAALELERRRAAEQEAMAMHDVLTGIMNRRAFFTTLDRAVQAGTNHGVMCIFDIDRFKEINDTYGHLAGDELLIHLARTIEGTVRATDAVARLGGDEFALFLHPPIGHAEVEAVLERITDEMRKPVSFDDRTVQCSVSVGASWIGGETMEEVRDALGRADAALYAAKTKARGYYRFSEDSAIFT